MKTLIAVALISLSTSSFASNDVLGALRSLFQEGFYFGFTPEQKLCTLHLKFFSDRAVITANNNELIVSRTVMNGSTFRFRPGTRELLTSDSKSTFRSLAVDESQTYTVTSIINEFGEEVPVECIVPTNP